MRRKLIAAASDLIIAALILGSIYGVNYLLPQKGVAAQDMSRITAENKTDLSGKDESLSEVQKIDSAAQVQQMGNSRTRAEELQQLVDSNPSGLPTTKVTLDAQDWHEKFADKFTDQIVSTDTSYTSPNLSIQLTYGSYQTGWITRKTAIMKNTVQIFLMFWPISM